MANRVRIGSGQDPGQAGKEPGAASGARPERLHRKAGDREWRQADEVRTVQLAVPRWKRTLTDIVEWKRLTPIGSLPLGRVRPEEASLILIGGVKGLGEPAVNGCEYVACFRTLAVFRDTGGRARECQPSSCYAYNAGHLYFQVGIVSKELYFTRPSSRMRMKRSSHMNGAPVPVTGHGHQRPIGRRK
jgi:hypothetical protein